MGVLLAFICPALIQSELQEGVIIKTIVSTEMIEPLARKHGVEVQQIQRGLSTLVRLWTLSCSREAVCFRF